MLDALARDGASFFDELLTVDESHIATIARRAARARRRGPRHERHDGLAATRDSLAPDVVAARPHAARSDALAPRRLHADTRPLRRAATPEPPSSSEMEASGQRGRRSRELARTMVARARPTRARPRERRARVGRDDRATVARRATASCRARSGGASVRRSVGARSTTSSNDSSSAAKCDAATSCADCRARSSRFPKPSSCCGRRMTRTVRPAIVMTASDPANVYTLPMPQDAARDQFVRPRSRGALLVSINGVVVMIAEGRGQRITVRPDTEAGRGHAGSVSAGRSSFSAREARHLRRDDRWAAGDGQPIPRRISGGRLQTRNSRSSLLSKPIAATSHPEGRSAAPDDEVILRESERSERRPRDRYPWRGSSTALARKRSLGRASLRSRLPQDDRGADSLRSRSSG